MAIEIGSKAPEFTLKDSEGNDVSLSDYKGKPVVLLFFPLAFTGVCTKELCQVRDNFKIYDSLNAQVLAISVDSFFTLQQFKQQQNFNFPLLSDFNKVVSKLYDTLYEAFFGMIGVSKRAAFVIDADGTLVYSEILPKASALPDFEKIQDALRVLQS